ncbi:MAG TPA: CDP-archaeol synthase [Gammaproteobacteria bacterium]|nr:CDP-archaeol synthase [Gammaproteobacteria bacterium]
MRFWLVQQLVLLLVITNATPVIISLLAGRHWNRPLDGNRLFRDQRPLLGPSKTVRGVLGAVLVTALIAPLFSLSAIEGASFALLAMTGDLCSSFIKRRLGIASSRSVPFLDQVPETVIPLWGMQSVLGASINEMLLAAALFIVIDLLLSTLTRPATAR